MHELSIALSVVDAASDAVRDAGEDRAIESVRIRVGALSGVVVEALHFAWDVAAAGTRCQGSRLEIEAVPARVHCPACDRESELASPHRFRCGHCGEPAGDIVGGRELDLVSLELADDPPVEPVSSPSSNASEASHPAAHP